MYKPLKGPKPLRISFGKIDGFIMSLDGQIKHLILFDYGLFNKVCHKIKYLISKKSSFTNSINHNFVLILYQLKILTFHDVIILIKAVVNKSKNKYY